MKLLILGGTRFVGRHLVAAALARNHEVTLFNRGTQPFPAMRGVETINGDRNANLSKLESREWDAAIDTSGYLPRTVRVSAELLSPSIDRYVYISSVSVYSNFDVCGLDESAPVVTLTSEQLAKANEIDASGQTSAVTYGNMYAGLKVLCEQAVAEVFPNRDLIIRPGLIVGPYDYTDRFTYWVMRVARGGEVVAPGRPGRYVQFIDARDLAEWIVSMIERKETGVFNANGLPYDLTMERVLEDCRVVSGSNATFIWVSEQFLIQEKVAPWGAMPLWMPEDDASKMKGFMSINSDRAVAAGLRFRDLRETVKDILTWRETIEPDAALKAGISVEREQNLLRRWHDATHQVTPPL